MLPECGGCGQRGGAMGYGGRREDDCRTCCRHRKRGPRGRCSDGAGSTPRRYALGECAGAGADLGGPCPGRCQRGSDPRRSLELRRSWCGYFRLYGGTSNGGRAWREPGVGGETGALLGRVGGGTGVCSSRSRAGAVCGPLFAPGCIWMGCGDGQPGSRRRGALDTRGRNCVPRGANAEKFRAAPDDDFCFPCAVLCHARRSCSSAFPGAPARSRTCTIIDNSVGFRLYYRYRRTPFRVACVRRHRGGGGCGGFGSHEQRVVACIGVVSCAGRGPGPLRTRSRGRFRSMLFTSSRRSVRTPSGARHAKGLAGPRSPSGSSPACRGFVARPDRHPSLRRAAANLVGMVGRQPGVGLPRGRPGGVGWVGGREFRARPRRGAAGGNAGRLRRLRTCARAGRQECACCGGRLRARCRFIARTGFRKDRCGDA